MWYTYWLACVEGITGDRKCELCRKNGSAEAVYYIEEKKYEDICEIMNMNYQSVRNLMHRGLTKLRSLAS